MFENVAGTLVSPDNTWVLWTILVGWAAISIYLEQKYKWAAAISGAIIGLLGAILLANLKIIPTESPVYDTVWGYVVPLAIPLLLYKANVKKIYKESGRLFLIFNISAVGTILGVTIAFLCLHTLTPEPWKVSGMMTGSYMGGGVNFVAMADAFQTQENTINSLVVADNVNMAIYLVILMGIPSMVLFQRLFPRIRPLEDPTDEKTNNDSHAASYWGRKEISLLDIAAALAVAFLITTVSTLLEGVIKNSNAPELIRLFFGQKYLLITLFTMGLATLIPQLMSKINGAQEIGTFLIYLFFVVLGVPADLKVVLVDAPLLFVFCFIVVLVNMGFTFFLGKICKFDLDEMCVASNANIGGPTTAAAMAIAKGWTELVVPALLVGIWGYVIGNIAGIFIGTMLGKAFGYIP